MPKLGVVSGHGRAVIVLDTMSLATQDRSEDVGGGGKVNESKQK